MLKLCSVVLAISYFLIKIIKTHIFEKERSTFQHVWLQIGSFVSHWNNFEIFFSYCRMVICHPMLAILDFNQHNIQTTFARYHSMIIHVQWNFKFLSENFFFIFPYSPMLKLCPAMVDNLDFSSTTKRVLEGHIRNTPSHAWCGFRRILKFQPIKNHNGPV
jgi:hypothetical protein